MRDSHGLSPYPFHWDSALLDGQVNTDEGTSQTPLAQALI